MQRACREQRASRTAARQKAWCEGPEERSIPAARSADTSGVRCFAYCSARPLNSLTGRRAWTALIVAITRVLAEKLRHCSSHSKPQNCRSFGTELAKSETTSSYWIVMKRFGRIVCQCAIRLAYWP